MPLKMKELPETQRPYEKLKMYGAENLSNAELLAIIIKTGTKEENSIDLANRVLLLTQNLNELTDISIDQLMQIKGIGEIKAIQIKAVCELTKRMTIDNNHITKKVTRPKDIADVFMNQMQNEKTEELKEVLLNTKNDITKIITIAKGDTNVVNVTIKEILKEPVRKQSPKIILVHNHPSGDVTPSKSDIELTKMVQKTGELFGIKLLDHIIIGNNNYTSIMSIMS